MPIGLLWLDREPHGTLAERVNRAASFYQRKYGRPPSICFVHPSQLEGQLAAAGDIPVRGNHLLRPNQIWLGAIEE